MAPFIKERFRYREAGSKRMCSTESMHGRDDALQLPQERSFTLASNSSDDWKAEGIRRAVQRERFAAFSRWTQKVGPHIRRGALYESIGAGIILTALTVSGFTFTFVGVSTAGTAAVIGAGAVVALGVGYVVWRTGKWIITRVKNFGVRHERRVESRLKREYGSLD